MRKKESVRSRINKYVGFGSSSRILYARLKPIEEQGAELVCRPVTTKYCVLSIFSKLNSDEREAVSNLLGPAYTSINDWNNPDNMDDAQRYLEQLKSAFDAFEQQYYDRQLPLIMQPIWKTEVQSAEIKKIMHLTCLSGVISLTHVYFSKEALLKIKRENVS